MFTMVRDLWWSALAANLSTLMATTMVLLANAKKQLATPTDVATPEAPASSRPTGRETAALSPRATKTTINFIDISGRKEPQGSFLHIDVLSTTNSATLGIYP
jgi:hypothetical protein